MPTKVIIKGFKQFQDQQIKLIKNLSEKQLKACAEATVKVMRFHIQTSIERDGSTGRLSQGIFASKILNGWGVGDIDYLNQNVKYWAWINYGVAGTGRTIPPSTLEFPSLTGHFSATAQGRFLKGQPKFPIFPKKAIKAHNYIDRTVQQIPTIVNGVLNTFRRL